jgi:single-strand DNA-binding protein
VDLIVFMKALNKVTLIGHLGKDPEIVFTENNVAVAKFTLATSETYKDKTGKMVVQTEWHQIVLWRGLAEMAQKFLHKGNLIYVEGKLKTRTWEDKEGNKKSVTEIIGDDLMMLDKKSDNQQAQDFAL